MSNEKPILFKDDMIRAILEGRKTQTRRVVKMNHSCGKPEPIEGHGEWWSIHETGDIKCPYGKPGDRLWVRERFAYHFIWDKLPPGHIDIEVHADNYFYGDGTITGDCEDHQRGKWRPSIHMPRWASRITLEITNVRVERLQDISEEDAIAEGAQHFPDLPGKNPWGQDARWSMEQPNSVDDCLGSARSAFGNYFCKLAGNAPNGIHDPRPWDANPWVWVIEFKRIDREAKAA